jgi:hypothetical protein
MDELARLVVNVDAIFQLKVSGPKVMGHSVACCQQRRTLDGFFGHQNPIRVQHLIGGATQVHIK